MPLEDLYPLSALQQGLLYETLADPDGARYVQQLRWRVEGPLDSRRYRLAWQRLVDRHPVLRTFVASGDDGRPLQAVLAGVRLPVSEADWRGVPATEQAARLEEYCRDDRVRGFDPGTAPLTRMSLIRLGEHAWESVWTFHHMLLDGWSIGRLINELGPLYADPEAELPQPPPYRDFIAWLESRDETAARSHWQRYLAGITAPAGLELAAGDPAGDLVAERSLALAERTRERLQESARRLRVTPSVVAQAAWAVVLSRYTGRDDVVFGTTVSGRPPALPRVEEMVGLFINTLPVRAGLRAGATAAELNHTLHAAQLEREPYEHTPLSEIQERQGTPLFDTLCVYENYPVSAPFPDQRILPGIDLVQGRNTEITGYALALSLVPQDRLRVFASFDPRRYAPEAVERLLGHYARILEQIADDPGRPVRELRHAGPREVTLLRRWGDGPRLAAPEQPVHELVVRAAAAAPGRTAVVADDGTELTYGELLSRSGRLARVLAGHGVGPGDLVGVCLPRGPELVVAVLAVLRAGGAYLPLEPDLPPARLEFMVADARPVAVVGRPGPGLPVDVDVAAPGPAADRVRLPEVGPDSLAYCLYTSGSTGRPKGVLVEHRALVNRLAGMQDAFRLTAADKVLHRAPLSFDVSARELLWPLANGACVVLAAPGGHRDPQHLTEVIEEHGVTVAEFVPPVLAEFVRMAPPGGLRSLRLVCCGGEPLPVPVARRLTELCGAELYNLYGPTEAAIDVAAQHVRRPVTGTRVPIGRPVHNTELLLLDRDLRPPPAGALGELYIGGVQLARGYLRRPELTKQRFVPHPSRPGSRLYRTGDLARWRPDGTLEFHGRTDDQVKIRGVRVEPGEVENTLRELPAVRHAVVSVREGRLHAHLVAEGRRPDIAALRNALARTLPEHMIPSRWHWLDELPVLPSGKVDRAGVLAATPGEAARRSTAYVAPEGPTEELVARVWQETLCVERVGAEDDFRELGGSSLDLVRIAFRLKEELDRPVELRELLRHPTVASLAAALDGRGEGDAEAWSPARERLELPEPLPARAAAHGRDILLTGATGYLGAFLLAELLERTAGRVRCLVRAGNEDEARRRLTGALREYGLSAPSERLQPVPGDLGRPGLGLTEEQFARLGAEVDLVVHAGARVDMLAGYDQLAPVNIGGTLELLRLAATGRLKPLHYISTSEPKEELVRSHVGYGLTKWRAERLAAAAADAGVPVGVFRMPRLTGDRRHGIWNPHDLVQRLLRLVLLTGAAPPLGTEEWVPVDEAAALLAGHVLGDVGRTGGLFSIAVDRAASLDELVELTRAEGREVTAVSGADWDARLAKRFPYEHELLRTLAEERAADESGESVADWGVLPQHAFTPLAARGVDRDLLRRYAHDLCTDTTTHTNPPPANGS